LEQYPITLEERLQRSRIARDLKAFLQKSLGRWEEELIRSLKKSDCSRDEVYKIHCLLVAKEEFESALDRMIDDGLIAEFEAKEEQQEK
jgi:hypothetical protein